MQVYYKDALGALLVYDVSRPETFESVIKVRNGIDYCYDRLGTLSLTGMMRFPS